MRIESHGEEVKMGGVSEGKKVICGVAEGRQEGRRRKTNIVWRSLPSQMFLNDRPFVVWATVTDVIHHRHSGLGRPGSGTRRVPRNTAIREQFEPSLSRGRRRGGRGQGSIGVPWLEFRNPSVRGKG